MEILEEIIITHMKDDVDTNKGTENKERERTDSRKMQEVKAITVSAWACGGTGTRMNPIYTQYGQKGCVNKYF